MKTRIFVLFLALSLGLAFAAIAADAPAAAPAAPEGAAPPPEKTYGQNVGDFIKPVTIATLDGKTKVEVDKLTNKTIFVMISSVCTSCRKEIQEISENYTKFQGKADVYGVVIDMDASAAAGRIGSTPFPLLADPDYKIGNATNLSSTPSTLIVKDGKIAYASSGYKPGQWKEYLR